MLAVAYILTILPKGCDDSNSLVSAKLRMGLADIDHMIDLLTQAKADLQRLQYDREHGKKQDVGDHLVHGRIMF